MRILHLIHSEGIYGAESILLYLAREQQHRGHTPFIGSIRDPGTTETSFESLASRQGLQVIPIRIAPRLTVKVVGSLLGTIRGIAPDVVHSHGYKPNILLASIPSKRRSGVLATLHGWTNTRRFTRMWLYERLDSLALRRLDSVVVVARHMLALPPLRGVAAQRKRVIENGIPPLASRLRDLSDRGAGPVPSALLEFIARQPTLVAIGRLSREKGFSLLLDAFAKARALTDASCQLLIVGEGPERARLTDQVASLGVSHAVVIAGYVDGADRLLEHAAGFVMSSFTEGLPLVILEAMQWEVPVLATAVGAIPDLLDGGKRGHLIRPYDLAALADGIRHMATCNRSVRSELVSAAREAVSQHYSATRMTTDYLAAYEAIA